MVAFVIQYKNFNGQSVSYNRLQFLKVHHDTAITRNADQALRLHSNRSSYSGWKVIPHGSTARICIKALTWFQVSSLEGRNTSGSVARNHEFIFPKLRKKRFDKT